MQRPDQRQRMSMPKLGGTEQLRALVDSYGGPAMVAKDFRLSEDLLARWLAGITEPPLTVFLALWWQGPNGMAQAFSESHWTHQWNSWRARQAEKRVALLEEAVARAQALLGHDHPALELPPPERPLDADPEPWRPPTRAKAKKTITVSDFPARLQAVVAHPVTQTYSTSEIRS